MHMIRPRKLREQRSGGGLFGGLVWDLAPASPKGNYPNAAASASSISIETKGSIGSGFILDGDPIGVVGRKINGKYIIKAAITADHIVSGMFLLEPWTQLVDHARVTLNRKINGEPVAYEGLVVRSKNEELQTSTGSWIYSGDIAVVLLLSDEFVVLEGGVSLMNVDKCVTCDVQVSGFWNEVDFRSVEHNPLSLSDPNLVSKVETPFCGFLGCRGQITQSDADFLHATVTTTFGLSGALLHPVDNENALTGYCVGAVVPLDCVVRDLIGACRKIELEGTGDSAICELDGILRAGKEQIAIVLREFPGQITANMRRVLLTASLEEAKKLGLKSSVAAADTIPIYYDGFLDLLYSSHKPEDLDGNCFATAERVRMAIPVFKSEINGIVECDEN